MDPENPELEDVILLPLSPRNMERIERLTSFLGCTAEDVLVTGLALLDDAATHIQGGGKVYMARKGSLRRSELLLRTPLKGAQGVEYDQDQNEQ